MLHYTAMHSAGAALARLCDPAAEVSAHYLISSQGTVTQMVPEDMRAWHAGAGEWHGSSDINSRSIGIELDNRGTHPFAALQITALECLLKAIMQRWTIPPENVIGHSDMAPGRKHDPGPHFDWSRLARLGLAASSGTHPAPATVTPDIFRKAAQAAGYSADVDDATLLQAIRLRHRPWARGPLGTQDVMALPNGSKTPPEA